MSRRDRWSSRSAFYFAAIGAAVDWGNVWRFPILSYQYGGGMFLIPYLVSLLLMGIPLLILEIACGQYWQRGDAGVFGRIHPRLTGIGISSTVCGFIVTTYYSMLLTWMVHALVYTFHAGGTTTGETTLFTVDSFSEMIGLDTLKKDDDDHQPTRFVGRNAGYCMFVWLIIFLCLAFGIQWTGRMTYFTMGLPMVVLILLFIRSVSYFTFYKENYVGDVRDGVQGYIGEWDVLPVLYEHGDAWPVAVCQVFFSLGIAFGIMTAFGSYRPNNNNNDGTTAVVMDSVVIAGSNFLFSILSGFALYCTLANLSYSPGFSAMAAVPAIGHHGSFELLFIKWPAALCELPGGIHWVRFLFVHLFLLGIDSAFALIEAFITVLKDSSYFQHIPRWFLTAIVCFVGFLLSFIYATDAGIIFILVMDYYINFIMILIGFMKAFGAGWMYGIQQQIHTLGVGPVSTYVIGNFGAMVLASGIWFGLDNGNELWVGFVALMVWYVLFLLLTEFQLEQIMVTQPNQWTRSSIWYELAWSNICNLRNTIQPVVGKIPILWCILMKQFIPHILIVVFIHLALSKDLRGQSYFGRYGGNHHETYPILGILSVGFVMIIVVLGMVFPSLYAPFNAVGIDDHDDDKKGEDCDSDRVQPLEDLQEDNNVHNKTVERKVNVAEREEEINI